MRNNSTLIDRRSLILAAAATLATPTVLRAEAPWPNRPIRFVVPLGPGGATDIVMRILAPKLGELLGQPCIVENRVGAGGVVGTDYVAKSQSDGYSFVHASVSSIVIASYLFDRLPYDPEKDLTPISPTVFVPLCLSVTRNGLNVGSFKELVDEMRAKPGKLSFASNGTGTTSHLAGANLLRLTGCQAEHIPYRSGADALMGLVKGEVQWAFDIPTLHGPQHREGNIRTIMATPQRQPLIPDIPDNAEVGMPDLKAYAWFGILGPAGLPQPVITRVASAMAETMADAAIRKRLEENGMPPMLDHTPAKFETFIGKEREFWAPIVRASGAKAI